MTGFKQYSTMFLVLISILLTLFLVFSQKKLQEEQKNFKNFKNESKELISLSNKWNENKNYEKVLSLLKSISKPKKEIIRGHAKIFEFANLSQLKLERIVKILFNSNFNIQKLQIQRNNNKLNLHIEVRL